MRVVYMGRCESEKEREQERGACIMAQLGQSGAVGLSFVAWPRRTV